MKKVCLATILAMVVALLLSGCTTKPVTLYTDCGEEKLEALVEPFTVSTGISVDIVHFNGAKKLVDAVATDDNGTFAIAEHHTLFNYADIVYSSDLQVGDVLKYRGALQQYTPEGGSALPEGARMDGWWYGSGGRVWVLAWNTDLVAEPPMSLLSLADDRFPNGSVTLPNPNNTLYYTCGAAAILGIEPMKSFLYTLLEKESIWEALPSETAQDIADGKAYAGLTTLAEITGQQKRGAKVAWTVPDQQSDSMGAYMELNIVCMPTTSTWPKEARMLYDYLLTSEAEALSVSLGLSDATLQSTASEAPVVIPLKTNQLAAQRAMNSEFGLTLTQFTAINPTYKGK